MRFRPPPCTDVGVALVGCGGIVNDGHLPAYLAHGVKIVGCFDLDLHTAERTASHFGIHKVYRSLEEVAADPDCRIVDIAVPPSAQPDIVSLLANAGKNLLCQKPLGEDLSAAAGVVQTAADAGVILAVNQQFRWSPVIWAVQQMLQRGYVGKVTDVQVIESTHTPWALWPWLARLPRLDVTYHSIHYLDAVRAILGDPDWITSRHSRPPDQDAVLGESKTVTVLDYDAGLQAIVAVNHNDISRRPLGSLRILGTRGIVTGTLGSSIDYSAAVADTITVETQSATSNGPIELPGKWMPDAFIGPMSSLITAVKEGTPPVTSGADNLRTMRMVDAAYLSAAENRSIRLRVELPLPGDGPA